MADRQSADPDGRTASEHGPVDLMSVAEAVQLLCAELTGCDKTSALQRLVTTSVKQVPGAQWASVSLLRGTHFTTWASSDDAATRADALQYEVGSGPCVDAVLEDSIYVTGDVASDPRWATWGSRAATEVGVRSVLAQRLHLLEGAGITAGLNIYSDQRDAFDDAAVGMGLLLATHAALALSEALDKDRADNLIRGLKSNREIGVAIGILMQRHQLTREQAFDVLRVASQNTNRKLADVATDVADTGTLEIRRLTANSCRRK